MTMIYKSFSLLFIYTTICFFTFGCQKSKKTDHYNEIKIQAYKLIDDNKEDEALSILDAEITKLSNKANLDSDEKNYLKTFKIIFSSALAKKSEITIYEFVNSIKISKKIDETFKQVNSLTETIQTDVQKDEIKSVRSLFSILQTVLKIIAVVPKVKTENMPYLDQAVRVIENIDSLTKGELMYLATLKIIYARNLLNSTQLLIPPEIVVKDNECSIEIYNFHTSLKNSIAIFNDSLNIIKTVLPKQETQLNEISKNLVLLKSHLENVFKAKLFIQQNNYSLLGILRQNIGITNKFDKCYE